jgi:hypothetical protein
MGLAAYEIVGSAGDWRNLSLSIVQLRTDGKGRLEVALT